jgi:hypothetical protein
LLYLLLLLLLLLELLLLPLLHSHLSTKLSKISLFSRSPCGLHLIELSLHVAFSFKLVFSNLNSLVFVDFSVFLRAINYIQILIFSFPFPNTKNCKIYANIHNPCVQKLPNLRSSSVPERLEKGEFSASRN